MGVWKFVTRKFAAKRNVLSILGVRRKGTSIVSSATGAGGKDGLTVKLTTGFADPRGMKPGTGEEKQQVPPLRSG
jgi:hypothetical protein